MYFDGTSDYLTIPSNSAFTLDGDFTIECWFYSDGGQVVNYPSIISSISFNTTSFSLRYNHTGYNNKFFVAKYGINGSGGANSLFAGTINVPYNTWAHVALVRSGTTCSLYVNGELDVTTTDSTDFDLNQGSQGTAIGGGNWDGAAGSLKGNITDLRVVKGTAVYTSAFTPPTAPLTAITNTSLLLNGTNAGIIDKSQSVQTLTLNGDVKSSTTQSKYLSSSMYFDGNGDYLMVPAEDSFELGSGDYTIECWVNISAAASVGGIFSKGTPGTTANSWGVEFNTTNNYVSWYVHSASSSTYIITGSQNIKTSNWIHIAVTRSGNDTKMFVDGVQDGSTYTGAYTIAEGGNLYLGGGAYAPTTRTITGYISDFRITKGLARYTANFTPPTAALEG